MSTYKIVRHYTDPREKNKVLLRGLSLRTAQTHCNDPETSSRTATNPIAIEHTRVYGPWFDGYVED